MKGPLCRNRRLVQIYCRLIVEFMGTLSCVSVFVYDQHTRKVIYIYLFLILIHIMTLTVCVYSGYPSLLKLIVTLVPLLTSCMVVSL